MIGDRSRPPMGGHDVAHRAHDRLGKFAPPVEWLDGPLPGAIQLTTTTAITDQK